MLRRAKSEVMSALKIWNSWSGIGSKFWEKLTFGAQVQVIHSFPILEKYLVLRIIVGQMWEKGFDLLGQNEKGFFNCEVFTKQKKKGIREIYGYTSPTDFLES